MAIYKVVSPKGKYKDKNVYEDAIAYVVNPHKAKSKQICLQGLSSVELAASEMSELARHFGKERGTRIRHSVLSFEKGEDLSPYEAGKIAVKLAEYYAQQGYQVLTAVHEDKPTVHIHMLMNTVNLWDGHKYEGKKKDYYKFQNYMKTVLKRIGIKLYVQKST